MNGVVNSKVEHRQKLDTVQNDAVKQREILFFYKNNNRRTKVGYESYFYPREYNLLLSAEAPMECFHIK